MSSQQLDRQRQWVRERARQQRDEDHQVAMEGVAERNAARFADIPQQRRDVDDDVDGA